MNTYILMASSAFPSFTIVRIFLFWVVTRPHRQLYLPVGALHAQQRHQKNQTRQWRWIREAGSR